MLHKKDINEPLQGLFMKNITCSTLNWGRTSWEEGGKGMWGCRGGLIPKREREEGRDEGWRHSLAAVVRRGRCVVGGRFVVVVSGAS
jgi:hypothetical protein